ncbi:hypothetical protein [Sphingobium sp. BS19]|uniref:hypothetical protein n=1 Tax=Sphingobium sp. BS19 TaxID=3018973 RepID=UPI0022EF6FFA|nr:hypothetical protein [Sphingobium sp. BS19]GLI99102.1 hypothetical protein Sbs19_29200 [Sphingobium sp. BS19]
MTNAPASTVEAKLLTRLVEAYRNNPVGVAKACDEQIDRSGNLLGYLREAASLTTQAVEPVAWNAAYALAKAAGALVVSTDGREDIRAEREAVLQALTMFVVPPSLKTPEQDA